jgi:hypothetical protein
LHPASAEHSNGSLRSNCWELFRQSVGNGLCVCVDDRKAYYPFLGTVATSQVFLFFFFFQTAHKLATSWAWRGWANRAAKQHLHRYENQLKKTKRETKEKWLSPHARDNQLQVGSSGDPIRPLVAEILNIYLLIGQGRKAAACLCAAVFASLCAV